MRIADAIEQFLRGNGWDDEVEKDGAKGTSSVSSPFIICNQVFEMCVEGDEQGEKLSLHLSPPFRIVEGKYVDACMYFNYLNDRYSFSGRLGVSENGWVRYREVLNTDSLALDWRMVDNMLSSGIRMFENHFDAIAAIALTRKSYEAVMEDYRRRAGEKEARREDAVSGMESET